MAIIKCKLCGGDIELTADKTFGTCEFCGSTMTLPKIDDDQRAAAFNRGNHFRRIGEFDKALAVYERIVREDDTDAEAHWCCALCRFGIEYVEDPNTYEWLPTCHRASFDSFLEDVDYLAALAHSDGITRRQYQKDAAKIAEVQRGILATSQNAEPYDVFICYKESDENGSRTRDSLMAQDIYYQLTEQGRKVFFARITLEDVVGTQYEPYIFAALNSAKVMIVVGTKSEYLNAVWVKNEWSRFLAMMKKDRHKLLLPCYRDMDPYDMPEQLSVLQSYDMSKIGFIQDLTRGISKVLDAEKKPESVKETVVVQQSGNANTAPLLERAFMFLEDGEWARADEFCEQVLNIFPKNAQAYVGKLMAELRVRKQESLKDCAEPFDSKNNYQKAIRFADDALKNSLIGYHQHIITRNELARLDSVYNDAMSAMNSAKEEKGYLHAADIFESIREHRDAAVLAQQCREKAEIVRKDAIYNFAKTQSPRTAIAYFSKIPGWKDADEQIILLQKKLEKERADAETAKQAAIQKARRIKKIISIVAVVLCVAIATTLLLTFVIIPTNKYNDAKALMDAGNYIEAIAAFEALKGYKDSSSLLLECRYNAATTLMDTGKYTDAISAFRALGDYKDSVDQINECYYIQAVELLNNGNYIGAYSTFLNLNYKDSTEQAYNAATLAAESFLMQEDFSNAVVWYENADNEEKANETMYAYVLAHYNNTDTTTYAFLTKLKERSYKKAAADYKELYAVTVRCCINFSENDFTSNYTERWRSYQDPYLHIRIISGGVPEKGTKLRIKFYTKGAYDFEWKFSHDYIMTCEKFKWYTKDFSYHDYNGKTILIKVIDESTNQVLTQITFDY